MIKTLKQYLSLRELLARCEHDWRKDMDWFYDNGTVDISCKKCKKLKNITIQQWRERYNNSNN